MLGAPEMARLVGKARAKLLELYGDLEKVSSSWLVTGLAAGCWLVSLAADADCWFCI
jgi:hypothetical protein